MTDENCVYERLSKLRRTRGRSAMMNRFGLPGGAPLYSALTALMLGVGRNLSLRRVEALSPVVMGEKSQSNSEPWPNDDIF